MVTLQRPFHSASNICIEDKKDSTHSQIINAILYIIFSKKLLLFIESSLKKAEVFINRSLKLGSQVEQMVMQFILGRNFS